MDKRKVVYIDDDQEMRELVGEAYKVGLTREDTEVEIREDFELLYQEEQEGNLADVYVLDYEIAGVDDNGADMALTIHNRANELDKNVLVIVLSSKPKEVNKKYGEELGSRSIPVLDKNSCAAICGFYVGRVLREDKSLLFADWLKAEGITLSDTTYSQYEGVVRDVRDNMLMAISDSIPHREIFPESGAFFETPRDFIGRCERKITQFMKPNAKELLEKTFNLQLSGQEVLG